MCDLYGIPNCDTMKKARNWLDTHAVDYTFHNYKKEGVNEELLSQWADQVGWELLLNRRGLTWRKLSDQQKEGIERDRAIQLMCDYPSMIKRPVLIDGDRIEVGFSEAAYCQLFGR
ncbi:ArsC family reductase [Mariprofundus sp. NF]|uniref:ArsC family reductase n=1 Tax=Mariprofundus sp. NF TaxID=2608716 RepID=UPI00159F9286|nr:ArsC family reductase [Mariprofundus sp. NF]NWF39787.1 ArsC family reductase [Mariprofundus sp. NF]